MPDLYLAIFEVAFLASKKTAHWALYLPPGDPNTCVGRLYGVKKENFSSSQTQFVTDSFDPQKEQGVLYIPIPGVKIAEANLLAICQEVAENRKFNLVTRNCQDWVLDVIKQVEVALNLKGIDVVSLARQRGYNRLKW